MKLNKKKKGFTLIELMAVIAIIAILAAVLVPTVSGYIERSKKTALITQVRNVVNAVEIYNSTAPDADKIADAKTIATLVAADATKGLTGTETKFVNQEFLSADDVSKLNVSLSYEQLKNINSDSNAMNGIYKSKTDGDNKGKFVYKIGENEVLLEYVAPSVS